MKCIGIDIGSYSIKIVEIQTTSKGFQLNQYLEHKLSNAAAADHELETIEYLRDFVSQYDATQTKFILALRQDRVALRNKIFPFSDRLKIAKSMAFELEEDIPFSVDNAIFDAKVIRTIGPTAEVLAGASPKGHVQKVVQFSQDIGADLALLSAEGPAFANIVERWSEPPQALPAQAIQLDEVAKPVRHIAIVLNIGHTHTLVCAFENNTLIGARSVLWGGKSIAEAIARKYEIPFFEAMKELETKAFILTNKQGASFDQVTFSETISKCVRELVRDVQLSILEFKSEFNAEILNVGMTGGTSQIQNLGAFLTQLLEVPVNKISTLQNFSNTLFEKSPQTEAKIGLALGLAVEGLKKPRNPAFNFLRGEFVKQNYRMQAFLHKWAKVMQYGVAVLVILFIYTNMRDSSSASLVDRTQEVLKTQAKTVAKLSGKSATDAGIKKYIRENKKRAADLKTLASIASMNSAMDVLKKITDATPAKNALTLDIRKLNINQTDVSLEGYIGSPRELTLLQQSLTNITPNGKVTAGSPTLPPIVNKTSFALNFQMDRGVQKVAK